MSPNGNEQPPNLWRSDSDYVVAVDPADLRAVWNMMREMSANGTVGIIGNEIYESVCSPGASVEAVWYRTSMIWMLSQMGISGDPTDAIFKVAASFPMKRIKVGEVHEGPPFDLEEFMKQVAA